MRMYMSIRMSIVDTRIYATGWELKGRHVCTYILFEHVD